MKTAISIFIFLALFLCCPSYCASNLPSASRETAVAKKAGLLSAELVVGPFDIHRKYPSMYGPYVIEKCKFSEIIAKQRTIVPESKVIFIEGNPSVPGTTIPGRSVGKLTQSLRTAPLARPSTGKRELYWFKGIKVQVLDENDQILPTGEFVCHVAVDVDTEYRKKIFPDSEKSGNGRIIILTQGQTQFSFPDGFAVPVASDESWTFTLQAGNHTTEKHRRVKHLLTLDLVKDAELSQPMKALTWYNPYIAVLVDKKASLEQTAAEESNSHCRCISAAESAPSRSPGSDFKDALGRRLAQHWVVPPGIHQYQAPITDERDAGFAASDKMIHAVWTHVHVLCKNAAIVECDGDRRKKLFNVDSETKADGGLEILRIDNVVSKEGIPVRAGHRYEMECTYNNVSNEAQDSMVEFGVFFADNKFRKPDWIGKVAESGKESTVAQRCSAASVTYPPFNVSTETTLNVNTIPIFDPAADGPLLKEAKALEISTSAGNIHIAVDPVQAPRHATQMYKLLKKGVFNGTAIFRYQPNYFLQSGQVEAKVDGQPLLTDDQLALLRRLPLEPSASGQHKKWCLSMSRFDDTDSAVSSFSILLSDAPHLDGHYTVFGRMIPDAISLATLEEIEKNWSKHQPWIIDAHEINVPDNAK